MYVQVIITLQTHKLSCFVYSGGQLWSMPSNRLVASFLLFINNFSELPAKIVSPLWIMGGKVFHFFFNRYTIHAFVFAQFLNNNQLTILWLLFLSILSWENKCILFPSFHLLHSGICLKYSLIYSNMYVCPTIHAAHRSTNAATVENVYNINSSKFLGLALSKGQTKTRIERSLDGLFFCYLLGLFFRVVQDMPNRADTFIFNEAQLVFSFRE